MPAISMMGPGMACPWEVSGPVVSGVARAVISISGILMVVSIGRAVFLIASSLCLSGRAIRCVLMPWLQRHKPITLSLN